MCFAVKNKSEKNGETTTSTSRRQQQKQSSSSSRLLRTTTMAFSSTTNYSSSRCLWLVISFVILTATASIGSAAAAAAASTGGNLSCSSVKSAYRSRGLPDRDVPQSLLPISGSFTLQVNKIIYICLIFLSIHFSASFLIQPPLFSLLFNF